MSDRITIMVNGDEREVTQGLTVESLLRSLALHPALVVVEHNREILDRDVYGSTPVSAGDVFELVHFVGGG